MSRVVGWTDAHLPEVVLACHAVRQPTPTHIDVAKFVKMTEYMQTASVDPIEVVRRHSLTTLVRDEIERHIVEGALEPGDKLNEADWATRLRVWGRHAVCC